MIYDVEVIADRLDEARERARMSVKEIALEIWPQQGDNARYSWYKKVDNRGSSFEIWEISRAVEVLRAHGLAAPAGWPFLDWEYASVVEKLNRPPTGA